MIQELPGKDLISRDVVENLFAYVVHELMSPLSSLLTGLDLLDVSREQQEILDLLKTSACTLRGRLELFRTALGAGGLTVDRDSVEKILSLLASDPTHDKIVFEHASPCPRSREASAPDCAVDHLPQKEYQRRCDHSVRPRAFRSCGGIKTLE